MHHLCVEGFAPLGRAPAFLVKDLGYLAEVMASAAKFCRTSNEVGVGAERTHARDRARQLV
jgi:hypothetical protein